MNVIKQFDNRLLNRAEVVVNIESNTTPSKEEVKKKISHEFKKPEENIVIESIYGKFGSHNFKIEVKIYDDAESLLRYETVSRKDRKKMAEEEKKARESAKKGQEKSSETNRGVN